MTSRPMWIHVSNFFYLVIYFSSLHPTKHILLKTTNLFSKVKLYGKSKIYSLGHLYQFNDKCLSHGIFYQGVLCKIFTTTFEC